MPFYTFIATRGEAGAAATTSLQDCADHDAAKAHARNLLAIVSVGVDVASVAIGCGAGDEIDWLGVYDREGGAPPTWSPDD